MKRLFLFAAIVAALVGCKGNEPDSQQSQQVTFRVNSMYQSQEPMNAPRRAPQATILDDEGGQALTDLYVFDGTTQLAHQTNDQQDFGTVTLNLSHGAHSLSFIATRSTGITVADGVMTLGGIRPTFGKVVALDVTASTPAQDLTLDRISGQLVITINDAFPAAANQIEFIMATKYSQINVTNLLGVNGAEWTQKVSCAAVVGTTGKEYVFNTICPSLTQEYTSDFTINVYNSSDQIIYTVTIDDVRFAANTKTMLSGNLFTVPSASVSVNTSWNTNIVGTW